MVINLLEKLISIPSVYGNEKEIADYCEKELSGNPKLKVIRENNTLVAHTEINPEKRTVALVGHLDTVDVPNSKTGKVENGKLYGLGASDMKAGDAVILKIAQDLKEAESRFNLFFILYEKEEGPYRENGLQPLFKKWKELLSKIDFAFVLEPTDNTVQVGCLGVIHAWFTFKGKRAHSARPWQGENAIHKSWPLLKFLSELKPKPYTVGGLTYYEVLNATMAEFEGGRNIIPESFRLNLNYRFSPTKSLEEAQKELKELGERFGAEVTFTDLSPAARPCTDNPVLREFLSRFKVKVEPKQAWTDVAQLSSHGIDAVNFGPGQPHQAHQVDEWVELEKVKECYRMLGEFLFKGAS
ncbi:peptidase M20 [Thermovibrio ammonificans HB-1]|uniref:Succinyl-diaminopimelate desuccinylase n=1 Tax=Thermovibrio ammonificans (strain DSM 15698 / JCM 12110 / HB-1) TaxID=648996 RepID=E8T698_THEA1|nr:succinyl-diaminopimelate desuccinylase [Thermovibrio ammonificans]ADU96682.1 peptidase M20 [Thermovibrio ammonificans HB-1]